MMYSVEMFWFFLTVLLAEDSRSMMLAKVDGVHRLRWLMNSEKPSGQ
jgi:hypothetical protein